jgi:Zn-dependent protease
MKCQKCGQETFLPFRCPHCDGYFCPEHRLPENHECPKIELARVPKEEMRSLVVREQKPHTYTVTYSVEKPRRLRRFSSKEIKHLIVGALIVMGVGLSWMAPFFTHDYVMLVSFTAILTTSFFTHEIAHKIAAQKRGLWAEFRLTFMGAILTLLSIISQFFKIISPGAVMISGFTDRENIGKIAIAGPTTNIALSTVFLVISILSPPQSSLMFAMGAAFNAWIALFNLIPFGILDGFKIFLWNKKVWVSAFTVSLVLTLISYKFIL